MYTMASERASVGIVDPLGGGTISAFYKYAPKGVTFAERGLFFTGPTPEGLIALADQVEDAARAFASRHYDVILFGCTSGSCIKGYGFDKEMIKRIERASGHQGLTTSTSVLEAFQALGAKKTVVLTQYPDETNEAEKGFLEDNGIEVLSISGFELRSGKGEFCYNSREHLYRQCKKLKMEGKMEGADAFFLSCMGFYTLPFLKIMEEDFGLPVITSHNASLWACMRHSNINDPMPELGKLGSLPGLKTY